MSLELTTTSELGRSNFARFARFVAKNLLSIGLCLIRSLWPNIGGPGSTVLAGNDSTTVKYRLFAVGQASCLSNIFGKGTPRVRAQDGTGKSSSGLRLPNLRLMLPLRS